MNRYKTRMLACISSVQCCIRYPRQQRRMEKIIKKLKRKKLNFHYSQMIPLFAGELTDKLLELIKSLTMKNDQYVKSIVFLYSRKNSRKYHFKSYQLWGFWLTLEMQPCKFFIISKISLETKYIGQGRDRKYKTFSTIVINKESPYINPRIWIDVGKPLAELSSGSYRK